MHMRPLTKGRRNQGLVDASACKRCLSPQSDRVLARARISSLLPYLNVPQIVEVVAVRQK